MFDLFGALFFGAVGKVEALGAVAKIEALPALLPAGTRAVVLEMHRLTSLDTLGADALEQLLRVLRRQGVALVLANVNEQPLSLMRRCGFEARLGEERTVSSMALALALLAAAEAVPAQPAPLRG